MYIKFPVGVNELHNVEIDYDMFNSKVYIYVDGVLKETIVLSGRPKEIKFQVGESEKHDVYILVRGKTIPVTTVYVDNNLLGTFR